MASWDSQKASPPASGALPRRSSYTEHKNAALPVEAEHGLVVVVITTLVAGEPAASLLVATKNDVLAYDPAPGLVMPAIVSVAAVLAASVHPVPRTMVTVVPVVKAVAFGDALQPLNVGPSVAVGFEGIVTPEGKGTVMMSPGPSPPLGSLVVNPTVQVVGVAPGAIEDPEKVTAETPETPGITTADVGAAAALLLVATKNDVLAYDHAPWLVMPAIVNVAGVLAASAQPPPTRVMTTSEPIVAAVAVQPTNPDGSVTTGVAGIPGHESNTT